MVESSKELDVVITSTYSPISISVNHISQTIDSLLQMPDFRDRKVHYNIWIAIDGLQPDYLTRTHIVRRQKWLKKIYKLTLEQGTVVVNLEWGHLSGSLSYVIRDFCKSEFLLVVQDDLQFIRNIPIESILNCMHSHEELKHIRFNKRRTKIAGLDTVIEEKNFGGVAFVKTNNWSDNNYITSRSHFLTDILPLLENEKTFPENILRPLNLMNPNLFGTFILGKIDEDPFITHLGEKRGRIRARFGKSKIVTRFPWLYKMIHTLMTAIDFFRRFQTQVRQG